MSGDDRDAPKLSDCPREVAACVEALREGELLVAPDGDLVIRRRRPATGMLAAMRPWITTEHPAFDPRLVPPVERDLESERRARLAMYAKEERARYLSSRRQTWADDEAEGSAA